VGDLILDESVLHANKNKGMNTVKIIFFKSFFPFYFLSLYTIELQEEHY
jgi:hypothetical protein